MCARQDAGLLPSPVPASVLTSDWSVVLLHGSAVGFLRRAAPRQLSADHSAGRSRPLCNRRIQNPVSLSGEVTDGTGTRNPKRRAQLPGNDSKVARSRAGRPIVSFLHLLSPPRL